MHYYAHHLGDYAKDTGHLSLAEHGAYRMLLDHYYATEKALPQNPATVARICRATSRQEREAVESVLSQFFTLNNTGYSHKRVEQELENNRRLRERNLENGKRGGRPKQTQNKPSGLFLGSVSETQTEPYPTTNNQQPTTTVLLEKEPKGKTQAKLANSEACYQANAEPIPLDLNTEEFRSAWEDWCNHRTAMAPRKPWTRLAARNSLAECLREGVVRSVQAISKSIANGWQGITFDALQTPHGSKPRQPSLPHL